MIKVIISFLKKCILRMKTIRGLNIKDWPAYVFTSMTNDEIDPEFFLVNDFNGCKDGSIVFNMTYCEENNVLYITFNNIECIFRKSGVFSCLIFCESDKKKLCSIDMLR